LAYTVTPGFKVELAYRYLNMGSAQTAEVLCGAAGCGVGGGPRAYYVLKNMDSHDLKLGVRWMLQPEQVYEAPLMRRG
jgi:opacity protein-like surface antigen